MENKMDYKKVLIIAGSDSGGGAGIQADLKTVSACGAYAATAITAITVQNTLGVSDIYPIPPSIIRGQMLAVLEDIGADAIKIGMLHSIEVMETVRQVLVRYPNIPVVLDPVMVATSGHRLMQPDASLFLKQALIPLATIITPNLPEAEVLLGRALNSVSDMETAARDLSAPPSTSVYLKAGHALGEVLTDLFYDAPRNTLMRLESPRILTQNTHGTGCTLSSAIAAFLAQGDPIETVVTRAKKYISEAIAAGADYKLGKGHGPVHHFHSFWK